MTEPTTGRRNASRTTRQKILGPWSIETSKRFWEGFAPSALGTQGAVGEIRAAFLSDHDWTRVEAVITQDFDMATIIVAGPGDLDAASAQVRRFLSLDIDAREWPEVGVRDPVMADAQLQLPGFRPCGFYSPYEAAVWSVLSQRIQMRQAAVIKANLAEQYGENGVFPSPTVLRGLSLTLPGRKLEYLHSVADAALDGRLSGEHLRGLDAAHALEEVQKIRGLGPFAAELIVVRGANSPDVLPQNEARLLTIMAKLYGPDESPERIAEAWRPFRSWAAVHLRALGAGRRIGRRADDERDGDDHRRLGQQESRADRLRS
ncbi:DNA-3-methyladenine glycosylase family protein [Subtercola frigoramans]|uniref:DNA-3-methyladenine glycosylase II n=1 Tax=Subtercola frigoramans TaxID=120298 RepID=A0ABS2L2I8_9MICO|nr:DNA-3-methyladenine glycosylase 2 family protein [Subtercola frigoramans]MBM7471302.1 DNA-3-methyladenine glycosylase II [Subtercola frigoramans]